MPPTDYNRAEMEWNNENILRFIDIYKEATVLWSSKHPDHYNRIAKQRAWELVADRIGTNTEECKKKIISLLSSLRRERMKVKKNRIAIANGSRCGIYKSRWFAYKSFMFLLKNNSHKRNASEHNDVDAAKSDVSTEDYILDDNDEDTENDNVDIETKATPTIADISKKRKAPVTNSQPPRKVVTVASVSTAQSDKAVEDECYAYGKFIGEKLKSYSSVTRSCVQHAISNLLFNADQGLYAENYIISQHSTANALQTSGVSMPQQQGRYVFVPVDEYASSTLDQNPLDSVSEVTTENPELMKLEMNNLQ